jgi:hypothetical protein
MLARLPVPLVVGYSIFFVHHPLSLSYLFTLHTLGSSHTLQAEPATPLKNNSHSGIVLTIEQKLCRLVPPTNLVAPPPPLQAPMDDKHSRHPMKMEKGAKVPDERHVWKKIVEEGRSPPLYETVWCTPT